MLTLCTHILHSRSDTIDNVHALHQGFKKIVKHTLQLSGILCAEKKRKIYRYLQWLHAQTLAKWNIYILLLHLPIKWL